MNRADAQAFIEMGNRDPFDADDDGKKRPARDAAHVAARGIINNLEDRHTIKFSLRGIDHETRIEIVDDLAEIIRAAMIRPADTKTRNAPRE